MTSPNVFDRVEEDNTPNAVTVRIWSLDGKTVGEASWAPQVRTGFLVGPALGNPVEVPRALNKAFDAANKYGYPKVVVNIDDRKLWLPEWGTLNEPKSSLIKKPLIPGRP